MDSSLTVVKAVVLPPQHNLVVSLPLAVVVKASHPPPTTNPVKEVNSKTSLVATEDLEATLRLKGVDVVVDSGVSVGCLDAEV
jgi:hypothetical protein